MDLETLLSARREADRDAAPIPDLAAAERALLASGTDRLGAAWMKSAARIVAEHQRQGRAERAWPVLRVMEASVAELSEREPASAGRALASLASQALLEGAAEAFLERARLSAEAFERAGGDHAGEAAVERAALGAALLALGVNDEAERVLDAAIEGAQRAGLRIAEAIARRARARLHLRRGLTEEAAGILRAGGLDEGAIAEIVGPQTISRSGFEAASWLDGGPAPAWMAIADARAASGDAAGAAAAIAEARRAVLAFASRLSRADLRRSYLERVPEHRRALALDRA